MGQDLVAITGVGAVTSVGLGLPALWDALVQGRHGFRRVPDARPDLVEAGVAVVAPAVEFDLREMGVAPRLAAGMDRVSRMTVYAGLAALDDAGLARPDDVSRWRVAAVVATGHALADRHTSLPVEERNPRWLLETYPSMALGYLSMAASLTGYGTNIVAACTGGTHAIGIAFRMIQSGHADVVLAGAAEDKLCVPLLSGFRRLRMCTCNGDPDTAMRPFDRSRDGFVAGQAACFLVVERLAVAERRGARPRCLVLGYGASMSATSLTDASADGMLASMTAALEDAHVPPDLLDYVNAHGSSTRGRGAGARRLA